MKVVPNADLLVVDDEVDNVRLLGSILERDGYGVRMALSGEAALEAGRARPPDLLLLDVNMPAMDGFEVCSRWRADPALTRSPVIFVSGNAGVADKLRGFEAGGVDYVTKPIQPLEVLARVRTHLTIGRQQRQLDELARCLTERNAELERANKELEEISLLDGLTQVSNRRAFDEYLAHEWMRGVRERTPLALLMCDIDYFKRLNDWAGHQAGDVALVRVAQAVRTAAHRPADMTARYGGEEFAVVLPNTPLAGALDVASDVRRKLAAARIPNLGSPLGWVSLSIGVACRVPTASTAPEELVRAADDALYRGKREGRDRIVAEDAEVRVYEARR